eukprot:SAG31_NODE_533_length_14371_cov_6.455367_18_plen_131_part_00
MAVHELMLKDKPRTSTYRSAIFAAVKRCKAAGVAAPVVLDVGAGTGVLSMFAAQVRPGRVQGLVCLHGPPTLSSADLQAGAARVYAVEASGLSRLCAKLVATNGLDSVVTVLHDKVEAIQLPEQVDILVS